MAQPALTGDATLNWDLATPITAWDGVIVAGMPARVWLLDLQSRGLTGPQSHPNLLGSGR